MDALLAYFEELRVHCRNNVQGHMLNAPASASTATSWKVSVTSSIITVNGVTKSLHNSGSDYIVYSSGTPIIGANQSCVAAFIAYINSGSITHTAMLGTAATTGVAPTAAQITSALTERPWIRLGETTLHDTGGVITQSYDSARRPILGVTVAPTIGDCSFIDRLKDAGL